ncbi:MAG: 2,3-bisphosphoglycerate-independent phosphoglycerate mutase [bacterium]|nr:2,3-bisphosphoglycerate-independent phosphoglycerate mutase [bacterium]
MSDPRKSVLLLILDGWGLAEDPTNSAIDLASTPNWDRIWRDFPRTKLVPHGEAVGLLEGQMGNSEVGHLNLGAGRVIYQDLVAITKLIDNGELKDHADLNAFLDRAGQGTLHFVGLFSNGGVHSHIDHLCGLANYAAEKCGVPLKVHALLDGRDTPPAIAEQFFAYAEEHLPHSAQFATLGGRYFGMDRDKRWQRTELAWDAIVEARGAWAPDWRTAMICARDWGMTDEFITPTVLGGYTGMQPGDSVICFNFRADRMRQLVSALVLEDFDSIERRSDPRPDVFAFTQYRDDFDIPVLLAYEPVAETLAEVCSKAGLHIYKSAETEKYAHVTYFFNGGREEAWPGEDRVLIPSAQVATYDLQPEMSIHEVTDRLVEAIKAGAHELLVVNYANPDMVGHTGVADACITACEAVDKCLGRVLEAAQWGKQAAVMVTADHGNCDVLRWPDGTPHTQHSMNLVPLVLVSEPRRDLHALADAARLVVGSSHPQCFSLCDVAPTILDLLGISKPDSWTGISLLEG